jgi:hypothetical protein
MKMKLLLMLLAVMLTAGLAQANMIANPGFEDVFYDAERERFHPMPWLSQFASNAKMSWMDDSAEAHSGKKYWKIWNFPTQGTFYSTYIGQGPIDVVEGKEYAFSVWAKCSTDDEPVQAWATCEWYDSNDASGDPMYEDPCWIGGALDVEDEWYYVDCGSLIAPPGAATCRFKLWSGTENVSKRVLYDDADMRIASITDADPPGGGWFKDSYPDPYGPQDKVILTWTNMEPNAIDGDGDVYVDVWFGYEPNNIPTAGWTKIIDANSTTGPTAGINTTTVTVTATTTNAPAPTPYYWKVVSYPSGAANIDMDHRINGPTLEFLALSEQPAKVVIDTNDMITWEGTTLKLNTTVTDDGDSTVTFLWEVDGNGVVFDSNSVEDPNISFIPGTYVNALIKSPSFEDGLNGWDAYGVGGSGEIWNGSYTYKGTTTIYAVPTDGDSLLTAYSDANEDVGVSQTLIETLAADTDYELTVDVCLTQYYREILALYRVQLLAGETVLAEDHNGYYLDIPGAWKISTVTHTSGPPTDPNVGEQLTIRLLAVDHGDSITCDNVQLTSDPPFPSLPGHVYTLTVTATDAVGSDSEKMTIDVYDTACQAGRGGLDLGAQNLGDLVGDPDGPTPTVPDCLTSLFDIAAMTTTWLDETVLTEPIISNDAPAATDHIFIDPETGVTASSEIGMSFDRKDDYIVDNSGDPNGTDPDGYMWLSTGTGFGGDDLDPYVIFDLGEVNTIHRFHVWNYNEHYDWAEVGLFLKRGVNSVSVEYGTTEALGSTVAGITNFAIATGPGYTGEEFNSFTPFTARYIKFDINSNYEGDNNFYGLSEVRFYADPSAPTVNPGPDMITVSELGVDMAATVTNNDNGGEEPQRDLFLEWSAEPGAGVVFDPNEFVEDPTVMITNANPDDPTRYKLTLSARLVNPAGPDEDPSRRSMYIDVYSDACKAKIAGGLADETIYDLTDLNTDCTTSIADLATLAETYLVDYTISEPAEKPAAE